MGLPDVEAEEVYGNVELYGDRGGNVTFPTNINKHVLTILNGSTLTLAKESRMELRKKNPDDKKTWEIIVEDGGRFIAKGEYIPHKDGILTISGEVNWNADPGIYKGYAGSVYKETATGKTINENEMYFYKVSTAVFKNVDNTNGHIYYEEGAILTGT